MMTAKELKAGKFFRFESEERVLEVQFCNHKHGQGYPFCYYFNGEYGSYKTFPALERKVKYLIEKFNLFHSEVIQSNFD